VFKMVSNKPVVKVITILLLLVMTLLPVAGCNSQPANSPDKTTSSSSTVAPAKTTAATTPTPSATATAAKTRYVEELKIGTTSAVDIYNPAQGNAAFGAMNYNNFVNCTFLAYDKNGNMEPNIFTGWKISEDGKSVTVTCATDKGITWHDGQPLTIDDILFSLWFPKNYSPGKNEYDHAEKIDDTTLKIFCKNSAFAYLQSICMIRYILPKHVWEKIADPDNPEKYTGADAAIGCGPYKYVSYDRDAQTAYFEAVGNSWNGKELTVKKVSLRSFGSADSLIMALKNGEVDAMFVYSTPLDPSAAPSITGVAGLDPGMSTNTGNFQLCFGFKKYPSNDLNFRTAVSYALDYSLLASTIGGENGEIPNTGIVPPPNISYDPSLPKLKQDIVLAKATLEAAGYKDINGDGYREFPNGEPMNIMVNPLNLKARITLLLRISEIIISNLKDIGIKATLDEQYAVTKVVSEGNFDLYIAYVTSLVGINNKTAFYYVAALPAGTTSGTCTIPEVVEAYKASQVVKSTEEFITCVKTLERLAGKYVPALALCWDKCYYPYRTDKYTGWINYPAWGVINNQTWYTLTAK
jgi:peptide/nickel transport system substrate-binding protein